MTDRDCGRESIMPRAVYKLGEQGKVVTSEDIAAMVRGHLINAAPKLSLGSVSEFTDQGRGER